VVQSVSDAIETLGFAWEPSEGEHLHLFEDIGLDSLEISASTLYPCDGAERS